MYKVVIEGPDSYFESKCDYEIFLKIMQLLVWGDDLFAFDDNVKDVVEEKNEIRMKVISEDYEVLNNKIIEVLNDMGKASTPVLARKVDACDTSVRKRLKYLESIGKVRKIPKSNFWVCGDVVVDLPDESKKEEYGGNKEVDEEEWVEDETKWEDGLK